MAYRGWVAEWTHCTYQYDWWCAPNQSTHLQLISALQQQHSKHIVCVQSIPCWCYHYLAIKPDLKEKNHNGESLVYVYVSELCNTQLWVTTIAPVGETIMITTTDHLLSVWHHQTIIREHTWLHSLEELLLWRPCATCAIIIHLVSSSNQVVQGPFPKYLISEIKSL